MYSREPHAIVCQAHQGIVSVPDPNQPQRGLLGLPGVCDQATDSDLEYV